MSPGSREQRSPHASPPPPAALPLPPLSAVALSAELPAASSSEQPSASRAPYSGRAAREGEEIWMMGGGTHFIYIFLFQFFSILKGMSPYVCIRAKFRLFFSKIRNLAHDNDVGM